MQTPPAPMFPINLTSDQQLFTAVVIAALLLIVISQSQVQKQKRHQRDRSLDLYIATEYKKMLFAMVKSTFRRDPPRSGEED